MIDDNSKMNKCFNCNKMGHIAKNCYQLHPELKTKDGDRKSNDHKDAKWTENQ